MAGPEEFLVVLMTVLILPAIAVLVTAFFLNGFSGLESAKYVVLMEDDGEEEWESEATETADIPLERRTAP